MITAQVLPEPLAGVHLKAAAWILSLVCRRGRTITQADKPVLLALWSAGADYTLEDDCPARKTWISRAELAERVGATMDALADSLKRLARFGWIRRLGRGWALAWRIPFTQRCRIEATDASGVRALAGLDTGSSCRDESPAPKVQALDPIELAKVQALDQPARACADQKKQKSEIGSEEKHNLSRARGRTSDLESRRLPNDRSAMHKGQQGLFADEVVIPAPEPAKCLAEVVFEHLRARIIQTKFDLGIKPATGPRVLDKRQRHAILSRIEEHGGGDEGVEACKRVIAVDEADCRRQGPKGPSWSYWNASTPFRNPSNFEGRLDRWREDGDHAVFGVRGGSSPRRDLSFQPAMTDEEEAKLWAEVSEGYD